MTLIIVFYHCNYSGEPFGSFDGKVIGIVDSSAEALAFVAMCWFFSISGFLLFRNLTFKNYAEKLKKRAVSLLVPYFIWEFAAVVPLIVIPLIRHSSIVSSKLFQDLLCGVFLIKSLPPNGALWYLYALFLLTALSPLFLLLFKNKNIGWLATVALTVLIYCLDNTDNIVSRQILSYGYIRLVFSYLPSFLIGAFMGHFSENSDGTDKIKYILSLLLAGILFEGAFTGIAKDSLVRILPVLILYFMPDLTAFEGKKAYRISFLVYAIHQPLLEFRRFLIPAVSKIPYAFFASLTLRFLFIIIIIAAAAFIHFVLGKIAPKLLNIVTGGRS